MVRLGLLVCLGVVVLLAGCEQDTQNIKIKGSETVLPISLELAETFRNDADRPGISVTAGGSGVGIAALLEQNADIAMASRAIKFEERIKFRDREMAYCENIIAYDALAVIVHPSNPLDSISFADLKRIFQDSLRNWKALGGPDREIVAINRESSSGTYSFFKKVILEKEPYGNLETVGANGELVEKIGSNPQTIGYVGLAYINDKVKPLKIHNTRTRTSVEPTMAHAMHQRYPLTRPLYFYYLCNREEELKPVLEYLMSNRGQELVKSVGYPPNPAYYRPGGAAQSVSPEP